MNSTAGNPNIRTGKHRKGRRTAAHILEQSTQVLMRDGYSQFSLRRVAQAAGVTLGNLQYYFPTKPDLVEAMLIHVVEGYVETFDRLMAEVEGRPEEQLAAVLTYVIRDLTNPRTTVLFPELWSMANHEPAVQQYVEDLYETYRRIVAGLIARINPRLSPGQVRLLTIFITASIEGHTPFTGHGKRWEHLTPAIEEVAIEAYLELIQSGDLPEVPDPE
ncbi:MAG: TetR/AcrR family transcriptional regulator [Gammaproteobacteria bacterium]|nr:TetR/AcrR family transcriptional regulator [Gammaproteobacteria bacterium]